MSTPQTEQRQQLFTFVFQPRVIVHWLFYSGIVFVVLLIPRQEIADVVLGAFCLLLSFPFIQMCLHITEYTARGHGDVPRLKLSFWNGRAYRLLFFLFAALWAYYLIPVDYRGLVSYVFLFLLPAMLAVGVFSGSVLDAINPLAIYRFITGMGGLFYSMMRLIIISTMMASVAALEQQTRLFQGAMGQLIVSLLGIYLALTMFRICGILLHARRWELGIQTDYSDESRHADQSRLDAGERQAFLAELQAMVKQGKADVAWTKLELMLKKDNYQSLMLFHDQLRDWTDRSLAMGVARIIISGHLKTNNPESAWQMFMLWSSESQGNFRTGSGDAILALANTARTDQQKQLALQQLTQLTHWFPNHPRGREAQLRACELALQLVEDQQALNLLARVEAMPGAVDEQLLINCRQSCAAITM